MLKNVPKEKEGKGGKRPGAGRTPEKIKAYCGKLLDKYKLYERAAMFAAGKEIYQCVNKDTGECIPIPVPAVVQLDAIKWLSDRADGKCVQTIESEALNKIANSFDIVIKSK